MAHSSWPDAILMYATFHLPPSSTLSLPFEADAQRLSKVAWWLFASSTYMCFVCSVPGAQLTLSGESKSHIVFPEIYRTLFALFALCVCFARWCLSAAGIQCRRRSSAATPHQPGSAGCGACAATIRDNLHQ